MNEWDGTYKVATSSLALAYGRDYSWDRSDPFWYLQETYSLHGLKRVTERARGTGRLVFGTYHSHPYRPQEAEMLQAVPSATDATLYARTSYDMHAVTHVISKRATGKDVMTASRWLTYYRKGKPGTAEAACHTTLWKAGSPSPLGFRVWRKGERLDWDEEFYLVSCFLIGGKWYEYHPIPFAGIGDRHEFLPLPYVKV